jgi:hypothetical protein
MIFTLFTLIQIFVCMSPLNLYASKYYPSEISRVNSLNAHDYFQTF